MELGSDEAIVLWELDCSAEDAKAPVSHIKVAQLKDKQVPSCLLVRDDSTIEIYKFTPRQGHLIGQS